MAKTYVFAIGGTGSRVLKSLSFLLASGVDCNSSEIIPIIIDPDKGNADKNRTIDILRTYQKIRKELNFDNEVENKFFRTQITSLNDEFGIHVKDSNQTFRNFVNKGNLSKANKALLSVLFSEDNLNAKMEVGFKGNPNIGSVVLNQFQQSKEFEDFATSFQQGDKIFIISSIFGGTGAAGFPLLLKNLRQPSPHLTNSAIISTAEIGAISVLPYFGVKNDDKATVDRRTFMSKTRAALSYYQTNLNKQLDFLYYLGDQIVNQYENNEGSVQQRNDAHFVELIAALAVIDFCNSPSKVSGTIINTQVKEFGIQNNADEVTFLDLYDKTKNKLFKPLTQFYLTHLYIKNRIREDLSKPANYANNFGMTQKFLESSFFEELERFRGWFYEWLQEMDRNKRSFTPFELTELTSTYYDKVKGLRLREGGLLSGGKHFERYTSFLNKEAGRNALDGRNIPTRFMEINYLATNELAETK